MQISRIWQAKMRVSPFRHVVSSSQLSQSGVQAWQCRGLPCICYVFFPCIAGIYELMFYSVMGNPAPIPIPIDPEADYILSGSVWLEGMGLPAECGLGAHQILWQGITGADLLIELQTFRQCVVGSAFSFNPPTSCVNLDAIFGPYY